jgi:F-type H+-transporting ATPase subunit b
MKIVETISMVSINETFFIELISFLIFLYLINRMMFRPLQGVMQERDQHMSGLSQSIEDARQKIRELNQQLESQEKEAVDEANRQRTEMEDQGAKQAEAVLAESRKQISAIQSENQREVDAQIAAARDRLQTEAERIAEEMMEKILDRRLGRG